MDKDTKNTISTKALDTLFKMFVHGIMAGKTVVPREYLETLGLDYTKSSIGFNSGQFHHRKDEAFRQPYIDLGILTKSSTPSNSPDRTPYTCFGSYGLIMPLKNKQGDIVNLFAHRFKLDTPLNEYLNDTGLFPNYPKASKEILYLVNNEIEASTLLQAEVLDRNEAVLSLREGKLSPIIIEAIGELETLKQLIVINNVEVLEELNKLSATKELTLPEGDTLNDTWLKYGNEFIREQLDEVLAQTDKETIELTQVSDSEFHAVGAELVYTIKGLIPTNPTLLTMSVELTNPLTDDSLKQELNLLDTSQTAKVIFDWSEDKTIDYTNVINELEEIVTQLIALRNIKKFTPQKEKGFSTTLDARAKKILKSDNVLEEINKLIGQSGVIGEERRRLLLFIVASSYKFDYNLHGVVHAENMSMAEEFITKIGALIPTKERYHIDVTTKKTFRYYGVDGIDNKCLIIPNYSDITSNKAIEDLKRLQSNGQIISDAPKKTNTGVMYTKQETVKGHTSSIGACSKTKKYFKGQPRTIIIGLDTTHEQEQKLMKYDCTKMAGLVNEKEEQKAKELLHYIIQNLTRQEVVNPFANTLMLPVHLPHARILTKQLMSFVNIVTLFNQHKREHTKDGKLIVTKNDIKEAINLFLDTILVNVDELDATTRTFFDKLNTLYENNNKKGLTSVEIRTELGMSKSTTNRLLSKLIEFEYLTKVGYKNTGFTYEIKRYNGLSEVKKEILNQLTQTD